MVLLWPDTHESEYTCTWLKQRAFNDVNRRHQAAVLQRPERLWTAADMDGRIPRIDYAEVLTADTRSTAVLSVTTFSVTVLLIVVYPCFATYWNVYKGACRRSQNGRSSWR